MCAPALSCRNCGPGAWASLPSLPLEGVPTCCFGLCAPQVFNVCTSPIVQKAWDLGQPLAVHGLVYDIADGILKVILG